MPAHPFVKCLKRWRFRLLFLLLQIPALALLGAEKRLATGHVPAAVARGSVAPQGRLDGNTPLHLALGLPLRNGVELSNLLAAIYNPASPQFHHYLTPRQFTERFGPTPEDYAALIHFVQTNSLGAMGTHSNRMLLDVTARAEDVERAFQLKLYSFQHPTESRTFFAPDTEPVVDARLPLWHISGLNNFSLPRPGLVLRTSSPFQPAPNAGSSPNGTYMGNDFRRAYMPGTALTGAGQCVALVQFDDFYPEDITNYASLIGQTNYMPQITVIPVAGGISSPGTGAREVTADIDMVLSMAPGVSNIYVYEAPNGTPWATILSQMADDNLASQLSCSWFGGGNNPSAEQCFLQMAAQGQSFYNASGDKGAYRDGVPFPCGSPNITQVGGTTLTTDTNGDYVGESAWNEGNHHVTGGGFAPGVPLPWWQLGVDMTTNNGSTVYRNLPDVALTANGIYIILSGQGLDIDGTSCAAPLWAGLNALINEQAAQLGQPPIGFINPALYSLCRGTNYPALFHDITAGDNTTTFSPTNYYTTPGFDLCTGWGTPTGTNLIDALTTPDNLKIMPPSVIVSSGPIGGPFLQTNWMVTLTNVGTSSLDWALGSMPSWLAVSSDAGTLAGHESTNLVVQLLAPEEFMAGIYVTGLTVTNLALSRIQIIEVQVGVGLPIVQNGGFETGDFTSWTLVGDTTIGSTVYNVVSTKSTYSDIVHSGYFGAFLGENGYAATLTQAVQTTPGAQYLVSFWLNNPLAGPGQLFGVSWDGTNYIDLVDPPSFDWTKFQFIATATDTNTILQIAARNDPRYFGLDDVGVFLVPPMYFVNCCLVTNGVELNWPALTGYNYSVQFTTNLTDTPWQDLYFVSATSASASCLDTNLAEESGQRFYRLVWVPPAP